MNERIKASCIIREANGPYIRPFIFRGIASLQVFLHLIKLLERYVGFKGGWESVAVVIFLWVMGQEDLSLTKVYEVDIGACEDLNKLDNCLDLGLGVSKRTYMTWCNFIRSNHSTVHDYFVQEIIYLSNASSISPIIIIMKDIKTHLTLSTPRNLQNPHLPHRNSLFPDRHPTTATNHFPLILPHPRTPCYNPYHRSLPFSPGNKHPPPNNLSHGPF